jgi:hypothetical protein
MKCTIQCSGNTLPEYALICALVLVVCMGALAMFGDSVRELFDDNARHISDKSGSGAPSWLESDNTNGKEQATSVSWEQQIKSLLSQITGDSNQQEAAKNLTVTGPQNISGISTDNALVLTGSNSIGMNATSADGNTRKVSAEQNVREALALIARIDKVASQMPEGPEKQWFIDAARKGLLLAGSEATDEVVKRGNQATLLQALADKTLNGNDVGFNIQTYKSQVQGKLGDMPAGMSASQKQLGATLVSSMLKKLDAESYETTYNGVVQVKTYSKSPEQIKEVAQAEMTTIEAGKAPVQGTLTNALTLDALGK